MRAPNSDLKGRVLDDLALGRGGRLFNHAEGRKLPYAIAQGLLLSSIPYLRAAVWCVPLAVLRGTVGFFNRNYTKTADERETKCYPVGAAFVL